MQDLLRDVISVVALLGMLLYIVIPVWFITRLVSVLASKSPLEKLQRNAPLLLALGAATLFILYLLDIIPPRREIPFPYTSPLAPSTADAIDQADAIVEGSFLLNHAVSSARAVFTGPYSQNLKVNVFVVPFQIDRVVKGPASGTISVKLFFTLWPNTPFYQALPLKEKLLLLLKKDPADASDYILVSQGTCWLVLANPHPASGAPADPATFILDDAKGFLAACLAHPGATAAIAYIKEPTSFGFMTTLLGSGGFSTISYPENDPARTQALRIGKDLGEHDPGFLALAKKYEDAPQQLGSIARSIRADSGDYSELETQLKTNNAPPPASPGPGFHVIDGRANLPDELYSAITDSQHPADLLPLVTQALASPDPHTRERVMQGLYHYAGKDGYGIRGNRLGNAYFPLVAKMLDDPDRQVQYSALGCLFCMSGCVKQRVPDREVNLPAIMIYQQDPDLWINKAKAWWEKHKAELMAAPAAASSGGTQ
jgi:hypothetical protein